MFFFPSSKQCIVNTIEENAILLNTAGMVGDKCIFFFIIQKNRLTSLVMRIDGECDQSYRKIFLRVSWYIITSYIINTSQGLGEFEHSRMVKMHTSFNSIILFSYFEENFWLFFVKTSFQSLRFFKNVTVSKE